MSNNHNTQILESLWEAHEKTCKKCQKHENELKKHEKHLEEVRKEIVKQFNELPE